MILDLGSVSDLIQVTAQYSNAVMVAVLPYFSGVAEKLDLPVPQPITQADVAKVHFLPFLTTASRDTAVSILLKDGWAFTYEFGCVHLIADSHGYSALQDPDEVSRFYGRNRMNKDEAVRMARSALRKLGISLEDVFAEQEPQVTLPVKIGTNTVPHYEIKWLDPRGSDSVDIHINGNTKQIERIYLLNKNLKRSQLEIGVIPPTAPSLRIPVNPEYARQLIPIMFKAIDDYAQKLSLPISRLLTTNDVAQIEVHDNGGWPHCLIELTNGWQFIYRHCMVNGYYAPDDLLSGNRPIRIKEFEGKWNLTTNQAIELVKTTLAKLNYLTNNIHMDFAPNIIYAAGNFKKIIPRYFFEWDYAPQGELESKVEAEVNADNGKLESLYYDDLAYWNSRPAIDVPISLPMPKQTNDSIAPPTKTLPKPPARPFTPFNAPK